LVCHRMGLDYSSCTMKIVEMVIIASLWKLFTEDIVEETILMIL
jgi:hypothetical protein